MGVGKGTLARALSKKTALFAVDTDDLIESLENRKIKKIFKVDGEEYFRLQEQKCATWLEKNVKKSIISTGGGFYKVKNLKKIGDAIYLKSSFEGILERINSAPNAKSKLAKRPLLQDKKKALELFSQRVKEYEKRADFIINTENKKVSKIVKEILSLYKKHP